MTLGEKIKAARLNAGLTQEQLAEKLMVSRPAVTKWESDRGIPDIENLKALSQLLGVSIDYLVGNEGELPLTVIKEPIILSQSGYFKKYDEKDAVIKEKYPDGELYYLSHEKILTKAEKITDNLLGFLTDAPFGIPDFLNEVKNLDRKYYLMLRSGMQFLVCVTDDFIETRQMISNISPVKGEKFTVGEMRFRILKKVK